MEIVTSADLATSTRDALLEEYSAGRLGRCALEEATGLWFGEILAELAQRRLPLPRVDSRIHFNEAQQRLYEHVFGQVRL